MPKRMVVRCLVAGLVLALVGAAWAEEEEKPKPPPTWRELAAQEGMTREDIERLAEQKVLVGVRAFPQIFSAYAQFEELAVFVTTDSVLRAYNVLLLESLSRVESARARALTRVLRSMWPGLASAMPVDAFETMHERDRAAIRRAQIVIGVALRLLGEAAPGLSAGVDNAIRKEVALVEAGVGRRRPPWLDTSGDLLHVLDYDRFRPRGIHTLTKARQRSFRATAWLQDVPFDLERDGDLLTIATLQKAFGGGWDRWRDSPDEAWSCHVFVRELRRLLGATKEPSVFDHEPAQDLEGIARDFRRNDEDARVVHVLPRHETPDSTLLAHLFDVRALAAPPFRLPSGLDLVAALGSDAGRAWRKAELGEGAAVPSAWPALAEGKDLFRRYLRALAHLVDEPDPAAPDLFRMDGWSRKSAQTVLGAWAQIRHACTLAAMDPQKYWCDMKPPPGWVEPEPGFFVDMLELAIDTEAFLRDRGAFDPVAAELDRIADLEWYVSRFQELAQQGALSEGWKSFYRALGPQDERRYRRRFDGRYYLWEASRRVRLVEDAADARELSREERQAAWLRQEMEVAREEIEAFEKERAENPDWRSRIRDPLELASRWEALQRVLGRLSHLASKQLRGATLDAADAAFLRSYAGTLAYPMLYDGNAFMNPPPDRPLVASVFSAYPPTANPRPDETAQILHAGVGMPVAIYVLWPHEGREVLCRGGVMPYREVVKSTRLTDEAWAERLDSDDAPKPPAWLQPITAPIRPRPNRK